MIVDLFADKLPADAIYANMQISLPDIIRGKQAYDFSATQSFSWDTLATNLGVTSSAIKVLSGTQYSQLPVVLANPNIKVLVLLVAAEDYKSYAQQLHIANSPRCVHKGVLFLQSGEKRIFMLDRRVAWYLMPKTVGNENNENNENNLICRMSSYTVREISLQPANLMKLAMKSVIEWEEENTFVMKTNSSS